MSSLSKSEKNNSARQHSMGLLKAHSSVVVVPALLFVMVAGFNYVSYYSSIAFFAIFAIWFWRASLVDSFVFIFAIQPLTTIFKLGANVPSFSVLFYALFILKVAAARGGLLEYRLPRLPFSAVVLLITIQCLDALFLGASILKIMALLLNVVLCVVGSDWLMGADSAEKGKIYFLVAISYCCSLIVMIVSADIFPSIPKVFLHDSFFQSSGVVYERFSGIAGDANYYSQLVLCGIAFMMGIFRSSKASVLSAAVIALTVFLIVSGARSYSKSFYITLVVVLMLGFFFLLKNGFRTKQSVASLIVVLPIAVIVAVVVVENYVLPGFGLRLESGQDLTTGRTKIWIEYAGLFFSDAYKMLFGTGFNNAHTFISQSYASHNAYIEAIVEFGVVGTIFVVMAFWPDLKSLRFFFADARMMYFAVIAITSMGLALSDYDFVFLSIMLLACFSQEKVVGKSSTANVSYDYGVRQ